MPTNWYPLGRETQPTLLHFKWVMTRVHPNLRKAAQGINGFAALMTATDRNMTEGSGSSVPAGCKLSVKLERAASEA